MYGDFSRLLGDFCGQYSGVLAQQGRLLVDAELNEQHAILLDYLRGLTTDLIGPFAGPMHYAGFAVEPVNEAEKCHAVRLGRGHYYVYGLRCQTPAPHRPVDEEFRIGEHEPPFVVYLAVWEQSVSAIQAPALIDPALSAGVPDTTRRSQVRWRPRAGRALPMHEEELTGLSREATIRAFHEYNADPRHRPTLGARAHSGDEPEPGPATAPVPWGYRGVENQLYRVEVHRGGDVEEATFKWSRDNGSVEFGLDSLGGPADGVRTATLQRVWSDARRGLEAGDWVEFVDDDWVPFAPTPALMRVQQIALATRQVTLQDNDTHRDFDTKRHPLLRRWDQHCDDVELSHGIPVREAHRKWFELEDGVQIRFEAPTAHYERGDFWLIPARAATGGVLWPQSPGPDPHPLAIPPHGPPRYLAPLALIRDLASPPTDLRGFFSYRVDEPDDSPAPRGPVVGPGELRTQAMTVIRPAGVRYLLRSVSALEPGAVYPVQDGTVIGRSADAGIHIEHNDVSRHHVVFQLAEGTLTITDLGSTNGTQVNGRALVERIPVRVAPGDMIQVGPPELQFRVETA